MLGLHWLTRSVRNLMDGFLKKGISIEIDGNIISGSLKDRAFLYALRDGAFEPATIRLFKEVVKSTMVVLDIGAYVGYYSILASKLVGLNGKVYAFEPDPDSFFTLCRNINSNNCVNVTSVQKALSDSSGALEFYIHPDDVTRTGLFPREKWSKKIIVESTTIDEIIEGRRVDVVKIDAEGAECMILDGMKETIAANPNLIIIIEMNPAALRDAGCSSDALLKKLKGFGYSDIIALDEQRSKTGEVLLANLYCKRS